MNRQRVAIENQDQHSGLGGGSTITKRTRGLPTEESQERDENDATLNVFDLTSMLTG